MELSSIIPYKGNIESRDKLYALLVKHGFRVSLVARELNLYQNKVRRLLWNNGFNSRDIKLEKLAISKYNLKNDVRNYRVANRARINELQRIRRNKKNEQRP